METTKAQRDEIKAFLKTTGMSASYFGKVAVGNSELVARLNTPTRDGRPRSVSLETAAKLRKYMKKRRAELNGSKGVGASKR